MKTRYIAIEGRCFVLSTNVFRLVVNEADTPAVVFTTQSSDKNT
jgi:hypothetical protein